MAKGINNRLIVIDQALCRSGLIELVANVDIFNVVDKSGGNLGAKGICLELVHVVIQHVAEVVPGRGGGQVIHKGINGAAGGVHIAAQHRAQCIKAALAGACAPNHALDLAVVLDPAKFHSVCAIINNNYIIKVLANEIYHVLFRLGKLQVMLARLKVIVAVAGIIGNGAHVGGQVSAFAANTGDYNHCRVRECLCIVDQVIAVLGCFRFRQSPVLCKHTNFRSVCAVSGIEIAQFRVQLKACVRQALQQRNRGVSVRQCAGAGAAVAGVGRGPAKNIQFAVFGQRQSPCVIQQHNAFISNVLAQFCGKRAIFLTDLTAAGGKGDHGVHGADKNQVYRNTQRKYNAQYCIKTDQILFGLFHLATCNHCHNQQHSHNSKANQISFDGVDNVNNVIHVD